MRGVICALWSRSHLEAGASHSAMATVSWKPLMRRRRLILSERWIERLRLVLGRGPLLDGC
eukprot:scaffold46892_cov27-Phaeocystis_antarctica.AAC.1